ncbi:hypothetical protein T09_5386 [Trichinella sp. T9]|nr:hypothetical protein T09_5386 [Trichinella sp. T9]
MSNDGIGVNYELAWGVVHPGMVVIRRAVHGESWSRAVSGLAVALSTGYLYLHNLMDRLLRPGLLSFITFHRHRLLQQDKLVTKQFQNTPTVTNHFPTNCNTSPSKLLIY